MLYLGSKLIILDNSGAINIKIINLRVKKTYLTSYVNFNNVVQGVVKKHIPNKKLIKKKISEFLIIGVKKKNSRKNGLFIQFNLNFGVAVIKKKHIYEATATRIYAPVMNEIKKNSKLKQISLLAKQAI